MFHEMVVTLFLVIGFLMEHMKHFDSSVVHVAIGIVFLFMF